MFWQGFALGIAVIALCEVISVTGKVILRSFRKPEFKVTAKYVINTRYNVPEHNRIQVFTKMKCFEPEEYE